MQLVSPRKASVGHFCFHENERSEDDSILDKRADDHNHPGQVDTEGFLDSADIALCPQVSLPALPDPITSFVETRVMQEIPIAIEATGPESYIELSMTEETLVSAEVDSPEEDFSCLAADASMPIAIVGMGFRGPGEATNVNKLWETILEQREAWTPIPAARWNNKAFYHPDHARHGTINVEGGHFLDEDVSLFDAPFFNMTSDEAAVCLN